VALGLAPLAFGSFSVPLGAVVAVDEAEFGEDWTPLAPAAELVELPGKIVAKGSGVGLASLLAMLLGVVLLGLLPLGIGEGFGPSSLMGPTLAVLLGLGLEATGELGLPLSQAVRARSKHKTTEIFIAQNTGSTASILERQSSLSSWGWK
jgi:hypothetical protein